VVKKGQGANAAANWRERGKDLRGKRSTINHVGSQRWCRTTKQFEWTSTRTKPTRAEQRKASTEGGWHPASFSERESGRSLPV